jgi:hypothetical protein
VPARRAALWASGPPRTRGPAAPHRDRCSQPARHSVRQAGARSHDHAGGATPGWVDAGQRPGSRVGRPGGSPSRGSQDRRRRGQDPALSPDIMAMNDKGSPTALLLGSIRLGSGPLGGQQRAGGAPTPGWEDFHPARHQPRRSRAGRHRGTSVRAPRRGPRTMAAPEGGSTADSDGNRASVGLGHTGGRKCAGLRAAAAR